MKNQLSDSEAIKFKKYQIQLFKWSIFGFALFIIAWIVSWLHHLLVENIANDNFFLNIFFIFPLILASTIIAFFTGGLTLIYWQKFAHNKKKTAILFFSFSILIYVFLWLIIALRH